MLIRFMQGAALGVCLFIAPAALAAQAVGIAAIVNDTIITTSDLSDREKLMLVTAGGNVPKEALPRLKSQALKQLINEALQNEEAARLSIRVPESEVDAAIAQLEKSRGKPPGSLAAFLKANGASIASMRQQVRTQLVWNKVVVQRLRRDVTISEDEISRAQYAELNSPGALHYNIAAISVNIRDKKQEATAATLVKIMLDAIASGTPFEKVARDHASNPDVTLNPSVWVAEDKLEPPIAAALRGLKPGQVTRPLRSLKTFQIVQFRDKREIKPLPADTDLIIKDTLFSLGTKQAPIVFEDVIRAAEFLKNSTETCYNEEVLLPAVAPQVPATGTFIMSKLGKLSPEIIPLISMMGVGETSEPIASPEGVRVLTLCEKTEPAAALADREAVKQKLFGEKIELEAIKHMRNLRRDAFIEVKSNLSAQDA